MGNLAQLQACTDELAAAVKTVVNGRWDAENLASDVNGGGYDFSRPLVPADATPEVHHARQTIIAKASRLQVLLGGPVDFLQHLSKQVRSPSISFSLVDELVACGLRRADRGGAPCRANCWLVCNGWANFRSWLAFLSADAFPAKISVTLLASLKDSSVGSSV